MQYILSEEEYQALKQKSKDAKADADKNLADVCMKTAQTAYVKVSWSGEFQIWGCVHTPCPKCGETPREGEFECDCFENMSERAYDRLMDKVAPYCDECVMEKVCPMQHRYSK